MNYIYCKGLRDNHRTFITYVISEVYKTSLFVLKFLSVRLGTRYYGTRI